MASLLAELKRRNVYKVAFAYLILGWLVLQITDVVAPALRLPDWTMSLVTYLGLIGFPFALLFTWAFELTPDGLKRSTEVDPQQSITSKTGQTLNGVIISMLALAVAFLLVDKFFLADAPRVIADREAATATTAEQPAPAAADSKPRSIAVLPFVNMSNDPDQEYFSDGISEELLNGLAKISELQVAARTSSFAFKGKNADITDIGRELKVETVLEGSVRKAGQRVRITAQLINVADGYHLWSEAYDRELTDIFAIQDEISKAIVDALKVHLTDQEVAAVNTTRDVDLDAYNYVLLARHNLRQRTQPTLERAAFLFQKAIDIDPGYAAAWAGKAAATELLSDAHYGETPPLEADRQAQQMVDMALRLEPDNAQALTTQALLDLNAEDPNIALASLEKAIAANPSEGILRSWQADALDRLGDFGTAMEALEEAYRLDPLHPAIRRNLGMWYAFTGRSRLAREIMVPGEQDYYEVEGFIALTEGRNADRERQLNDGAARVSDSERSLLIMMRNFNRYFQLGNEQAAYEEAGPMQSLLLDAFTDPERALATIASLSADEYGRAAFQAHMNALLNLERHRELIATYESRHGRPTRVAGSLTSPLSEFSWLISYAEALKATGEPEAARALATDLKDYLERSIAGGLPKIYMMRQARIALILDDTEGAIAALKAGMQYNALNITAFSGIWFEELHNHAEYVAIREAWSQQVDAERARLDWPPLEIAAR